MQSVYLIYALADVILILKLEKYVYFTFLVRDILKQLEVTILAMSVHSYRPILCIKLKEWLRECEG